MDVEKKQAARDELRQHAAAEVIELGEILFDLAIDAAARRPARGEEVDALLVEEMRGGGRVLYGFAAAFGKWRAIYSWARFCSRTSNIVRVRQKAFHPLR